MFKEKGEKAPREAFTILAMAALSDEYEVAWRIIASVEKIYCNPERWDSSIWALASALKQNAVFLRTIARKTKRVNESMNEIIQINYDNDRPTVSAKDLHDFLGVKTAYKDWFPRMCEYGFIEGQDFCSFLSESTGGRPAQDAQLTIDMAKELCMLQRNERGKQARQYFIQLEKDWNSPEKVMARALQIADRS
jgi:phage anti-repressor protein